MFLLKLWRLVKRFYFFSPLHSTMFLLKREFDSHDKQPDIPLHSTMFLLKPIGGITLASFNALYIPQCFY